MRRLVTTALAGLVIAAAAVAQVLPPGVSIGRPAPITTPLLPTLPAPAPAAPLSPLSPAPVAPLSPPPPEGFGVVLPPGTVVSPVFVRPPVPVMGAPEEIPPGPRFWASFEYLLWRSKGGNAPPLVVAVPGATPTPSNAVIVSDHTINGDLQSGLRLTAGMWLDKPHGTGVVASYMSFLESRDATSYQSAPGVVLARPFIDATRGLPALFQLSTPTGTTVGVATVRTSFDADGFEVNMLRRGPAMIGEEMHWLVGVRYFGLEESLSVEALSETGGLRAGAFDTFSTRNNFYGAQVGGRWNFTRNQFTIDVMLKLGLGGMGQEAVVQGGSTVVMPSGARLERPGGLLALGSNIGDHDRTKLVLLRDFSISVGYCLTPNVTLRLGYDALWLSNVLRPGDQIDLGVNPTLLPFSARSPAGPARPEFRHNGESFYMHGISLGLAVQF